MTQVRQCELIGVDSWTIENGPIISFKPNGKHLVCWITDLHRLTENCVIELKDVEGIWKVNKIHDPELDHKEIKRNWHVGGL